MSPSEQQAQQEGRCLVTTDVVEESSSVSMPLSPDTSSKVLGGASTSKPQLESMLWATLAAGVGDGEGGEELASQLLHRKQQQAAAAASSVHGALLHQHRNACPSGSGVCNSQVRDAASGPVHGLAPHASHELWTLESSAQRLSSVRLWEVDEETELQPQPQPSSTANRSQPGVSAPLLPLAAAPNKPAAGSTTKDSKVQVSGEAAASGRASPRPFSAPLRQRPVAMSPAQQARALVAKVAGILQQLAEEGSSTGTVSSGAAMAGARDGAVATGERVQGKGSERASGVAPVTAHKEDQKATWTQAMEAKCAELQVRCDWG